MSIQNRFGVQHEFSYEFDCIFILRQVFFSAFVYCFFIVVVPIEFIEQRLNAQTQSHQSIANTFKPHNKPKISLYISLNAEN